LMALRPATECSSHVLNNPLHLLGYPGVNTWSITLCTAIAPGHHSYEGVVATRLQGDQGPTRVTLAGVLARVRGTQHVLCYVRAGVHCRGTRAHSIADSVDICLIQHTWLGSSRGECSPPCHSGRNIVIVVVGVWQAGWHHTAGECHVLGEAHHSKVIIIAIRVVVRMVDPL